MVFKAPSNPNLSKILYLQPEHLIHGLQSPQGVMKQLLQSPISGTPWCKSLVSTRRGQVALRGLSPSLEGPGSAPPGQLTTMRYPCLPGPGGAIPLCPGPPLCCLRAQSWSLSPGGKSTPGQGLLGAPSPSLPGITFLLGQPVAAGTSPWQNSEPHGAPAAVLISPPLQRLQQVKNWSLAVAVEDLAQEEPLKPHVCQVPAPAT